MSDHEQAHDVVRAAEEYVCTCLECIQYRQIRTHESALWALGNRIDHLESALAAHDAHYARLSGTQLDEIAAHVAVEMMMMVRSAISLWLDKYTPGHGD